MNTGINSHPDVLLDKIKRTLVADFGCDQEGLDREGVSFCLARRTEGARVFPLQPRFLAVVSMGKGVIVSCSPDRLKWAKTNLSRLSADQFFSAPAIAKMQMYVRRAGQFMAGPDLKYVCSQATYHTCKSDFEIVLLEGKGILDLYQEDRFPNALGRTFDSRRPTVIVSLAKHEGTIAGMAAASADCDMLWQVGVDVLKNYRGKGISKALVSRVTERILELGRLPYYSTWLSNIASQRTAASVGFRPVWVELYSRQQPF